MGLDIYARWGKKIKVVWASKAEGDGEPKHFELRLDENADLSQVPELEGIAEEDQEVYMELDFPKEYYEDQMAGFSTASQAGYIRESWGSLSWVRETAKKLDAPFPYDFFPDWEGWNGETKAVDTPEAMSKLLAFRDETLRPWLRGSKTLFNDYRALPEVERKEAYETLDVFRQRVADTIGFINFLEVHKDKPNLTIEFG